MFIILSQTSFISRRVGGTIIFECDLSVEAENLTDASSESQIKGKSCRIFELGLHLNKAMPTSLPTSVVNIQQYHETYISYLLSIDNPTNMQWVAPIFNVFENYPGAHLEIFNTTKVGNAIFVIAGS